MAAIVDVHESRAPRDLLIPATIFRRPRRGRRPALT